MKWIKNKLCLVSSPSCSPSHTFPINYSHSLPISRQRWYIQHIKLSETRVETHKFNAAKKVIFFLFAYLPISSSSSSTAPRSNAIAHVQPTQWQATCIHSQRDFLLIFAAVFVGIIFVESASLAIQPIKIQKWLIKNFFFLFLDVRNFLVCCSANFQSVPHDLRGCQTYLFFMTCSRLLKSF